jgi:hypothetical protein
MKADEYFLDLFVDCFYSCSIGVMVLLSFLVDVYAHMNISFE